MRSILLAAALFFVTAVLSPFPACYAQNGGGNGMSVDDTEAPVGPVTKNRPPAPSGHTVPNRYPEGFLTISEPSLLHEPAVKNKSAAAKTDVAGVPRQANWLFLLGMITAVGLFLAVAWIDHVYRIRLQTIVAQNNRLLNGEDIDLINDAPAVGIPLFLGTNEAIGDGFNAGINEYLAETADDLNKPETTV